ncbi:MAG TPA: hypothetical protein V6D20_20280, partial [Candidatus Obscuribacterales bacterium]
VFYLVLMIWRNLMSNINTNTTAPSVPSTRLTSSTGAPTWRFMFEVTGNDVDMPIPEGVEPWEWRAYAPHGYVGVWGVNIPQQWVTLHFADGDQMSLMVPELANPNAWLTWSRTHGALGTVNHVEIS